MRNVTEILVKERGFEFSDQAVLAAMATALTRMGANESADLVESAIAERKLETIDPPANRGQRGAPGL